MNRHAPTALAGRALCLKPLRSSRILAIPVGLLTGNSAAFFLASSPDLGKPGFSPDRQERSNAFW
jgi:hypothetical protein